MSKEIWKDYKKDLQMVCGRCGLELSTAFKKDAYNDYYAVLYCENCFEYTTI